MLPSDAEYPNVRPVAEAQRPSYVPYSGEAEMLGANDERLSEIVTELFGRNYSREELLGMLGINATDFPEVNAAFHVHSGRLAVNVQSEGLDMARTFQRRYTVDENDNDVFLLEVHNDHFLLTTQGTGIGSRVFTTQVRAMRAAGVNRITTEAARSVRGAEVAMNGYYTWPRLGYDAALPSYTISALPVNLSTSTRVSDLMTTQEGRDWWRQNGQSTDMEFDLTAGSLSNQVLDAYAEAKGI